MNEKKERIFTLLGAVGAFEGAKYFENNKRLVNELQCFNVTVTQIKIVDLKKQLQWCQKLSPLSLTPTLFFFFSPSQVSIL